MASYAANYSQYFQSLPFRFPAGLGVAVVGWFLLQNTGKPREGTREISIAEYKATPTKYLVHPDLHPTRTPKVPHMADVPDARTQLFHAAHYKDPLDAAAVGHH